MKKNLHLMLWFTFLFAPLLCAGQVTYPVYVDNTTGDDANDGKTPEKAWKTLAKISSLEFGPGAEILFKAGERWEGALSPKGSGSSERPIIINKYGNGNKPVLSGVNTAQTIYLYNQQYWEIKNIRVTNYLETSSRRRGIYVVGNNFGTVNHVHISNVEVDSVNSEAESFESRYYGGIFFKAGGSSTPTAFNDILIDSCYIHDVGRTGISNDSDWAVRSKTSRTGEYVGTDGNGVDRLDNWTPSTNFVVRNSKFERIDGNGLIIRVAKNALVENNLFEYCGMTISGNATFCFNTDSTVFQHNEAAFTVYNDGDTDARGIDSDFRSKYTIIQYNYLHHNGLGGVVATGGSGEPTWWERFNDSTIIRYNLLLDNEDQIFATSGKITNMLVYNNTVYTSSGLSNVKIIRDNAWGGASIVGARYYNNIFFHLGSDPTFGYGNGQDVIFENNIFFGNHARNEPDDPAKIITNPLFLNHTNPEDGFRLREGSPATGSGKLVFAGLLNTDYFENPIPENGPLNIGMDQGATVEAVITGLNDNHLTYDHITLFPVPAVDAVQIRIPGEKIPAGALVEIADLTGRTTTMHTSKLQINGDHLKINLTSSGFSAGIYILKVKYTGKLYTARFVIRE